MTPYFYSRGFVSFEVLFLGALRVDVLGFSNRKSFVPVDLDLDSVLEVGPSIDL